MQFKISHSLFLALILVLFNALSGYSQMKKDTLKNNMIYVRDTRMDMLINKRAELNKKTFVIIEIPNKGYRVQAMSTSDRTKVLDAKAKILSTFPQHRVYLLYQAPYFKLRVGNFVDKESADFLRAELAKIFSAGVITIPSDIELTKKEKEDLKTKLTEQAKEGKTPQKKKN
jgi:hypothetical protein